MKKGDQVFVSFLRSPGPRRESSSATVVGGVGDVLDLEVPANPARRLPPAKLFGVAKGPKAHGAYWLEKAPAVEVETKGKTPKAPPAK